MSVLDPVVACARGRRRRGPCLSHLARRRPGVRHHLAAVHRGRRRRRPVALLPLAVHGVRLAHASARARPQLRDLAERYRNRKDPESLRAFADERRRIASEHGMSRLGFLPLLVQMPIWLALYHLLAEPPAGASVGAMSPELVASSGAATLLGVPLAERGYLGAGWTHLAVVAGLAGTAAAARLRHPEVPGRAEHRRWPTCPRRWPGAPADAGALGPGRGRRRRRGSGGAPRLLGLQRRLDARPVGGRVAVVPHAGVAGRQPRPQAADRPGQRDDAENVSQASRLPCS